MKYEVHIDDNFHFMDEDERYKLGQFRTAKAAIRAAKKIVDEFLRSGYTPGMTAEELYQAYTSFGEDPFILSDDPARPLLRLGLRQGASPQALQEKGRVGRRQVEPFPTGPTAPSSESLAANLDGCDLCTVMLRTA